jgi:hypothetical protein
VVEVNSKLIVVFSPGEKNQLFIQGSAEIPEDFVKQL